MSDAGDGKVLIWDLPVRLFHWLLALSLAASWLTAEAGIEWMDWHFRFGYFAGGLIVFRIIWGFVGTKHARFSSFVRGASTTIAYARTLFDRNARPSAGHNPLGGLMVLLMMLVVGLQVGTGLFASDDIFTDAPFHPLVSDDTASLLTSIHHANFNVILGIVGLHIAAVLLYVFWKKQALIRAMIVGTKPADESLGNEAIASSRLVLAAIIAFAVAAGVAAGVSQAPEPVEEDFY